MRLIHSHKHWPIVRGILSRLREGGHKAYLAGGCVRDAWLGVAPKDFDIATSATPDQVESLFSKTVSVGKVFGVMVVVEGGLPVEVATFRGDGAYLDGRRPSEVEFSSAQRDAVRRDFTINGLFYDPQRGELIDFVEGRRDLEAKVLRAIGEPNARFQEDYLRILRGVRFSAQFDLQVNPQTLQAMQVLAHNTKKLSRERVREELEKMLALGRNTEALLLLQQLELTEEVFDPWFSRADFSEALRRLKAVSTLTQAMPVRWAALMSVSFLGRCQSKIGVFNNWMREYKFSNASRELVIDALKVLHEVKELQTDDMTSAWIAIDKCDPKIWCLLEIASSSLGKSPEFLDKFRQGYVSRIQPESGRLPPLLLSGSDLLREGIAPGAELGGLLKEAYRIQVRDRIEKKATLLTALLSGR